MTANNESIKQNEYSLGRILSMSDGVFAFAVTLLILDLTVPALQPGATSWDLWDALSEGWVSFFSYLLSFFIAGIWWNSHHRTFSHIRVSNSTLRWLNLLFLLWIALLPFYTKILDEYIDLQLSVVLYATDGAAAGVFMAIIWWYASKNHRLIDKGVKDTEIRFGLQRNVIAPVFFGASIGLSFIGIGIAIYSWGGMIIAYIILSQLQQRRENPRYGQNHHWRRNKQSPS